MEAEPEPVCSASWRRLLRLVAPSAAVALYAFWIRPAMLTWGATPEEATCTYPGDGLVPDPDGGATMATVLPAPPEKVWPWLVQMGGGRGGCGGLFTVVGARTGDSLLTKDSPAPFICRPGWR